MERGWTVRLTPAERCLPLSANDFRVVAGSVTTRRKRGVQFAVEGMDALLAQGLEVGEDLPDAGDGGLRPHRHGRRRSEDRCARRACLP